MHPTIETLIRVTATLRAGLIIELMDTSESGVVRLSFTRLKIGRSREHDLPELQIQTECRNRRGGVVVNPYVWCDWTADGIVSLLRDYEDNEVFLLPLERAVQDPLAASLATLETSPVSIGAKTLAWDAKAEKIRSLNASGDLVDEDAVTDHFCDVVCWTAQQA